MKQKLLTGKIFLFFVSLLMSGAWAAEPKAERTYRFNIEPQSLRTAVPQFARQAGGLNFALSDGRQAARIQVNKVSGDLTRTEALRRMLESTGVDYRMPRANLIVFRVPQPRRPPDQVVPPGLRVPEIVIAGSRDLGSPVGADGRYGDVRSIKPDQLAIGSGVLADALGDVMLTGIGTPRAGDLGSIAGNQMELNLFGLGTTDTTLLLNGRPMAGVWLGGAPMQPKLGVIPPPAVEEFKIVTGSASSIYGGGAGGTVDVRFRKGFEGLQIDAAIGGVHGRDAAASVSYGGRFFDERTSVTLDLGVARETPLLMSDRDGLLEGRKRILRNNPDYWNARGVPPLGELPNISSANGSDLGSGLGQSIRLPAGYSANPSVLNNAGGFDFSLADTAQEEGGPAVLQSGMEGASFIAQAEHQLTRDHKLLIEVLGNYSQTRNPASAAGFLGLDGVRVPADAPNNPFDQPVRVTRPIEGADGVLDERNVSWRGTLGASWQLNSRWSLNAEYIRSESRLRWSQPAAEFAGADAASGALDVLQDPALGRLDVSRYLYTLGTSWLPSESESSVLSGTGTLIEGRDGFATVFLAATRRADSYGGATVWQESPTQHRTALEEYSRQSQETWSAFAELNAEYRWFELQLAGRWEQTQMEVSSPRAPLEAGADSSPEEPQFTSFSPRATLRWNPLRDFSLRASVGRGFVMPTVTQLAPAPVGPAPPGMFSDPQRGYESVTGATVRVGGNPSLGLEESKSVSAGIIVTPRWLPNFELTVDRTRIHKRVDISSLLGFDLETLEDLGRVERDAPLPDDLWSVGPVVGLDLSDANVSRVDVDFWQSEMRGLTKERPWGQLEWFARGTWQPQFLRQLTPDSPMVNEIGIGSASALRFSAAARAKWHYKKHWSVAWTTRHADSYQVSRDPLIILNQGGERVSAQTFHDVTFGWRLDEMEHGLKFLDVRLAVTNVFNREPEFDAGAALFAYYSPYADPRLRHARLMFSFTF